MSGTSADGIDVAIVRVSPGKDASTPRLKVLGHRGFPYPRRIREDVLRAMEGASLSAAQFSRLSWSLGELYAQAVQKTCTDLTLKIKLVGLHGQTIAHEPPKATWQIGEPAILRERLGVPVVSDFRSADLAAGGQGAPLVPMLDFCLFRSATKNRVLLNLGGIANVSAMPAGGALDDLLAFDTGPANMVIDHLMHSDFGKAFDRGGSTAAKGRVFRAPVDELLRESYFHAAPPKSCGREQFGQNFSAAFATRLRAAGANPHDIVASATELTAASIIEAYGRFCWAHLGQHAPLARATEVIAAGGGVNNLTLMRRLESGFAPLGVKLLKADTLGLASQAKEAVAFALLAWLSFHGLPGNVPSATGARGLRTLGKVTC